MDWVAIFQQAGFPVLVAIGLAMFTRDQLKREQKRADERETSMATRIQHLEDKIENTLVSLVNECKDTLGECNETMRQATAAFSRNEIGTDTRRAIKSLADHKEST